MRSVHLPASHGRSGRIVDCCWSEILLVKAHGVSDTVSGGEEEIDMWRRSSVITGLVFLALVVTFPAMANHSWGDYHWNGDGLPLELTLEDNLDDFWGPGTRPGGCRLGWR